MTTIDHTYEEVAPHQVKAAQLRRLVEEVPSPTMASALAVIKADPDDIRALALSVAEYLDSTAGDLTPVAYAEIAYAYVEGAWMFGHITSATRGEVLRLIERAGIKVNR